MEWEWLIVGDWISPAWFTGNLNGIWELWTGNLGFGLEMDLKPWGQVQVCPSQSKPTDSGKSVWILSFAQGLFYFNTFSDFYSEKHIKNNMVSFDLSETDSILTFIKNMFTSPISILIMTLYFKLLRQEFHPQRYAIEKNVFSINTHSTTWSVHT